MAENTINIMRIKERYEPYKKYIQYRIVREQLYSKIYARELETNYPNLFDKGEIKRIKNYETINYTDFIFSKIIQDLLA